MVVFFAPDRGQDLLISIKRHELITKLPLEQRLRLECYIQRIPFRVYFNLDEPKAIIRGYSELIINYRGNLVNMRKL